MDIDSEGKEAGDCAIPNADNRSISIQEHTVSNSDHH